MRPSPCHSGVTQSRKCHQPWQDPSSWPNSQPLPRIRPPQYRRPSANTQRHHPFKFGHQHLLIPPSFWRFVHQRHRDGNSTFSGNNSTFSRYPTCKRLLECGRWHFHPSTVAFGAFDGVGAQDYMVSLLLSRLKMCFSIDFANNLIEKSPTSAAAAIIDPTIVFLIGEDHPRPPKNEGSKEWVGINLNILWGERNRWVIS